MAEIGEIRVPVTVDLAPLVDMLKTVAQAFYSAANDIQEKIEQEAKRAAR